MNLLDIEIVEVIVVEIERASIEAVDSDKVVQIENVDVISAAGEKCSDDIGRNMLYALLDTIAAGKEFLSFLSTSNYEVDRRAIYYSDILSKGCEKKKTARVNRIVSS